MKTWKKKVYTFKTDKMFIGLSPLTVMRPSEIEKGYTWRYPITKRFNSVGNSMLFKRKGTNTYVHVGTHISEFKPNAKIVEYVSVVGNNDVPYPYAIDDEGNLYDFSYGSYAYYKLKRSDIGKRMDKILFDMNTTGKEDKYKKFPIKGWRLIANQ